MTIYLVRHAKAGERRTWDGDDRLRPLSMRGHRQANGLLDTLADASFARVLSSPYVRCMETVVPLAAARSLPVEPVEALAEGSSLDGAIALVRKHALEGAVVCTHGDIMPMLLEHYVQAGAVATEALQWPKGCTWALDLDSAGDVRRVSYFPPPPD